MFTTINSECDGYNIDYKSLFLDLNWSIQSKKKISWFYIYTIYNV